VLVIRPTKAFPSGGATATPNALLPLNPPAVTHQLLLVHAASLPSVVGAVYVLQIPKELYHTFDFIVIDPPFITAEVWADYAKAAKLLLVEGTEVSCST